MTSFLDKLNLTPQEKRLVVIVGIVVFVVLNLWLVWPHFGDLGRWQQRKRDMAATLRSYKLEIQKQAQYQKDKATLREGGSYVADENQARELVRRIQRQAFTSGVLLPKTDPARGSSNTQTNQFFDEKAVNVSYASSENQLVDFLFKLGSGGSLIRVQSISIKPSPQQTNLNGNITLVQSFQRTPPKKPATPAPAPATTAAKPAAPQTTAPPATVRRQTRTETENKKPSPTPIQPQSESAIPKRKVLSSSTDQ